MPTKRASGHSPDYARGRRVYFTIMAAAFVLALSSNPFGILDTTLRMFVASFVLLYANISRSMLVVKWSTKFSMSRCRCLYGEPCWPSDAAFAGLQEEVSQPLVYPKPPAIACYPAAHPSSDCEAVLKGSNDGVWRSGQSGSMQNSNFETHVFSNGTVSACYINASLGISCEQGSIPVVGVDARNTEDVSSAVRFAARNNLRLTIKNTGYVTVYRLIRLF